MRKQSETGSTFFEEGIGSALDEQQGRYGRREPVISGGEASVEYPRLPEDNPQNQHAKVPDEPPLGWSVSAPIVTGEFHETEESPPPSSHQAPDVVVEDKVQDAHVASSSFPTFEHPASFQEEIDDGCPGPRRPDGTPMSTSLPRLLRRRA